MSGEYITNIFTAGVSSAYASYFDNAIEFWNKVIRNGPGGIVFDANLNVNRQCGVNYTFEKGTEIKGFTMLTTLENIDGPGRILGGAGICYYNENDAPVIGIMIFDTSDLQSLINSGNFQEVVVHEIAHIIGLGSNWNAVGNNLVTGLCPTRPFGGSNCNPKYTGQYGIDAYRRLGGVGDLPIANTGSQGTINVHWRESVFENELMTGYLNSGITNPVSILTIASFRDLGYEVNENMAQEYSIPSELARPVFSERIELSGDILKFPVRYIEDDLAIAREIELEIEVESDNSQLSALMGIVILGFVAMGMMMMYMVRSHRQAIQSLKVAREEKVTATRNPML